MMRAKVFISFLLVRLFRKFLLGSSAEYCTRRASFCGRVFLVVFTKGCA